MAKTKHNPTDATLRNVRSAQKKLADLTLRLEKLERLAVSMWRVEARIKNLEQLAAKR